MIDPPIPKFTKIDDVFKYVYEGEKPVILMLMGTIWSPICRYTFQALSEVVKDEEYKDLVQPFYVDQDDSIPFCYEENIPVGFPCLIPFSKSYIANFTPEGRQFDPNDPNSSKNRLICQLNERQFKSIIDDMLLILDQKKDTITIPH